MSEEQEPVGTETTENEQKMVLVVVQKEAGTASKQQQETEADAGRRAAEELAAYAEEAYHSDASEDFDRRKDIAAHTVKA